MSSKKTVMLLLSALPIISACTPCAVSSLPTPPTFAPVGTDMQDKMEQALAPIGSETTLPNATSTVAK